MSTFTIVNDETLSAAIAQCKQQLVYVAPGITLPVVNSIRQQMERCKNLQVTFIIDVDPEVYRLGYGTVEGLQALQALINEFHLELRQQEGLRIGLLICDERTLVYSPTPLLIEAGSISQEKPNAVWVGKNMQEDLKQACEIGAEGEIGKQAATPSDVDKSLQSLKNEPPKRFDLARIERVYSSKIQFVELEVKGYKLTSKKITIPNDLLIGDDKALNTKLKNSFQLLNDEAALEVSVPSFDLDTAEPLLDENGLEIIEMWDEKALESARKRLYEDFLINVPRYGWVIMCSQLKKFEQRFSAFQTQVEAYQEGIVERLEQSISSSVDELASILLQRMNGQLPKKYSKWLPDNPSEEEKQERLAQAIRDEAKIDDVKKFFSPEVRYLVKGVTYASTNDQQFLAALEDAMHQVGAGRQFRLLFSEYDAARES